MKPGAGSSNFETFVDSLSGIVIQRLAPRTKTKPRGKRAAKGKKRAEGSTSQTEGEASTDELELGDFIEYLAEEIFSSLPSELRALSYASVQNDSSIASRYSTPLDSSVVDAVATSLPYTVLDSLASYELIDEPEAIDRLLEPVLSSYIAAVTAAPPEYTPALTASRPNGCEICQREHLPLTYHHLIPRQVHEKALKRGWHHEWELNKVAWLCRACHSFVHKVASNEELAREWYSVDLLMQREDIHKWAAWAGKVRWKAR